MEKSYRKLDSERQKGSWQVDEQSCQNEEGKAKAEY